MGMADKSENHAELARQTAARVAGKGGELDAHDPPRLFKAGLLLLRRESYREALVAFKAAVAADPDDPVYRSYLGLCLAEANGLMGEAIQLCQQAVEEHFYRADLYHNLGRVYLCTGSRSRALDAFRKGLAIDPGNAEIRETMDRIGTRQPPVFSFLSRGNALNRMTGKIRHKLGGHRRK